MTLQPILPLVLSMIPCHSTKLYRPASLGVSLVSRLSQMLIAFLNRRCLTLVIFGCLPALSSLAHIRIVVRLLLTKLTLLLLVTAFLLVVGTCLRPCR